jgi:HEAT repeat protein
LLATGDRNVARELSAFGADAIRAVEPFLDEERRGFRNLLRMTRGPEADAELVRIATTTKRETRRMAIDALGHHAAPSAVDPLLEMVARPVTTRSAAEGLARIGDRRALPAVRARFDELVAGGPESTRRRLIEAKKDIELGDVIVTAEACARLGDIRPVESLTVLVSGDAPWNQASLVPARRLVLFALERAPTAKTVAAI